MRVDRAVLVLGLSVSVAMLGVAERPALASGTSCQSDADCALTQVCMAEPAHGGPGTVLVCRRDPAPPVVTLDPLPSATRVAAVVVSGTVVDNRSVGRVRVLVDGVQVWERYLVAGPAFQRTVTLVGEGPHIITVVGLDVPQNRSTVESVVVLDTVAPRLFVKAPLRHAVVPSPEVPVAAWANDTSPLSLDVDGAPAVAIGLHGWWSGATTLTPPSEGLHLITVTARDAAGNEKKARIKVTLDATAPVVTPHLAATSCVGPLLDDLLEWSFEVADLTATHLATTSASVLAAGLPGGGGSVPVETHLEPGTQELTFTVEDAAHHVTSFTRTVGYDREGPVLVATPQPAAEPFGGWYQGPVTVAIAAQDVGPCGLGEVRCALDGGAEQAPGPEVLIAGDGVHRLRCTSVDAVGNVGAPVELAVPIGPFTFGPTTRVLVEPPFLDGPDGDRSYNAEYLEHALTPLGLAVEGVTDTVADELDDVIVFRAPDRVAAPDPWDLYAEVADGELPFEGFRVIVRAGRIEVLSGDPRGQRYAARWLVETLTEARAAGADRVAPQVFEDAPRLRLRAQHVSASRADLERLDFGGTDALEKLAAARMNALVWRVDPDFPLQSLDTPTSLGTPAWRADGPAEKQRIRDFLARADSYHIVVVPELKLLSHQEKLLGHAALGGHYRCLIHDISKGRPVYDPLAKLDGWDEQQTIYSELLLPLLDEVIDLFSEPRRPLRSFHVGHDETEQGELESIAALHAHPPAVPDPPCPPPSPRVVSTADLFFDDLLFFKSALAARKLRTLMWGDMLLDPFDEDAVDPLKPNVQGLWNANSETRNGRELADPAHDTNAVDRLRDLENPRDLVVVNWQYGEALAWKNYVYVSNDYLADRGLTVVGATWKDDAALTQHTTDQLRLAPGRFAPGMVSTAWGLMTGFNGPAFADIVAFAGDVFWHGEATEQAPNLWPKTPAVYVGDRAGHPKMAFVGGDVVSVWIAPDDDLTPPEALAGWAVKVDGLLARFSPGADPTALPYTLHVTDRTGVEAPPEYTQRIDFVLPPTTAATRGNTYPVEVRYTDAAGLPGFFTVEQAIYVGTEAPLADGLLVNGGFEDATGWAPASGVIPTHPDTRTSGRFQYYYADESAPPRLVRSGGRSLCVQFDIATDCGCSFFQVGQSVPAASLAGKTIGLRYWISVDRAVAGQWFTASMRFGLEPATLTWGGPITRSFFVASAFQAQEGVEYATRWLPFTTIVTVPVGATSLKLAPWMSFLYPWGSGTACFDDVEAFVLTPAP